MNVHVIYITAFIDHRVPLFIKVHQNLFTNSNPFDLSCMVNCHASIHKLFKVCFFYGCYARIF